MVADVNEFTSAAVSDRGLNASRPQNEDSFLEMPKIGLFAVADGVGGAQAGEVASQMAVEILGEAFANMNAAFDPEEMMRVALERANEAIFQMSNDLPQLSSMATTVVALHVSGDIGTIAHVGDSRIYRVDGNGRLFRETDDHSVVEEEVRAGRMTPEQALNHPSRNVISRALGAEDHVEPDIKCVLIHPGTRFLLCSDGITRHIDDSEIESLLASEFGPEDICARMKEICFSRGADDNLTAVVVSFPGDRKLASVVVEDDDIDEVTIATARQEAHPLVEAADYEPLAETIKDQSPVFAANGVADTENTGAADGLDPSDDDVFLIEPQEPDVPVATSVENLTSSDVYHRPEGAGLSPALANTAAYNAADEAPAIRTSRGTFSTLTLLIVGAIAGAAVGYFALKAYTPVAEAPAPVISEQKSNNVPLTSFEETRRLVDNDPTAFLNANAVTPTEASDYFWLGRALLLTGKPVEAKRAYDEAKRLLPSAPDVSNVRTMSNETEMALAILNSPQATESFTKAAVVPGVVNSNSNGSTSGFSTVR